MKKVYFFALAFLCTLLSPAQVMFEKTFSGVGELIANDVHQTADGGFIIVGTGNYAYMSSGDILLIKTDAAGDTLWTKYFGGFAAESGNSVLATSDGGYIIAASTNSFGAGGLDAWIIKTDGNGNMQWNKTIGTIGNDEAYGIVETADGGFVFSGNELTYGINGYAHLVKINSVGNVVWAKTYGNNLRKNYVFALQKTTDGGFIMGGYENNYLSTNDEFSMIKADSAGVMQWYKSYGDLNFDHNFSVCATPDGGFAIAGINFELPGYNYDVNLLKTGADGTLKWTKSYGGAGHEDVYCVNTTSDGGFIFGGSSSTFSGYQNGYFSKTDSVGNMIWSKTTSGTGYDIFLSAEETADGGFVLAGVKDEVYGSSGDLFFIKTDANGNTPCDATVTGYTIIPPTIVGTLLANGNSTELSGAATPTLSSGFTVTSLCCEAPGGLFTNNITTNRARLNWTIEPGAVQYEIWYKKATAAIWKKKFLPGTSNKFNLKNLQCNKAYVWQIRTICDTVGVDLVSGFSPVQSFTTLICKEGDVMSTNDMTIYPNPANNYVHISYFGTDNGTPVLIKIYNLNGVPIYSTNIENQVSIELMVNTENYPSGIYIIQVTEGAQMTTARFVISK